MTRIRPELSDGVSCPRLHAAPGRAGREAEHQQHIRDVAREQGRQLDIDRLVGDGKDVADPLDIGEGGAAQAHQPVHQFFSRVVGCAGKRAEACDEKADPARCHRGLALSLFGGAPPKIAVPSADR